MEDDKNKGVSELKPGATIRPGDTPTAEPSTPSLELPAPQPVTTEEPAPKAAPTQPAPEAPGPAPAAVPEAPVVTSQPSPSLQVDADGISWTASEFVEHDKSFDWYLALAVVAVLVTALLYFLFRDIMTAATPLVAALALGFYGRRRPRQLHYQLDSQGLAIDQKYLPYNLFRSFAIMDEGPFVSLVFLPLKRFGFLTTIYLDPKDEEQIIDLVSQHLPLEPREHDPIDRLMKRIRF
jgi:hypothetical protein